MKHFRPCIDLRWADDAFQDNALQPRNDLTMACWAGSTAAPLDRLGKPGKLRGRRVRRDGATDKRTAKFSAVVLRPRNPPKSQPPLPKCFPEIDRDP
jgi:hypothetical protein